MSVFALNRIEESATFRFKTKGEAKKHVKELAHEIAALYGKMLTPEWHATRSPNLAYIECPTQFPSPAAALEFQEKFSQEIVQNLYKENSYRITPSRALKHLLIGCKIDYTEPYFPVESATDLKLVGKKLTAKLTPPDLWKEILRETPPTTPSPPLHPRWKEITIAFLKKLELRKIPWKERLDDHLTKVLTHASNEEISLLIDQIILLHSTCPLPLLHDLLSSLDQHLAHDRVRLDELTEIALERLIHHYKKTSSYGSNDTLLRLFYRTLCQIKLSPEALKRIFLSCCREDTPSILAAFLVYHDDSHTPVASHYIDYQKEKLSVHWHIRKALCKEILASGRALLLGKHHSLKCIDALANPKIPTYNVKNVLRYVRGIERGELKKAISTLFASGMGQQLCEELDAIFDLILRNTPFEYEIERFVNAFAKADLPEHADFFLQSGCNAILRTQLAADPAYIPKQLRKLFGYKAMHALLYSSCHYSPSALREHLKNCCRLKFPHLISAFFKPDVLHDKKTCIRKDLHQAIDTETLRECKALVEGNEDCLRALDVFASDRTTILTGDEYIGPCIMS